MRRGYGGGGETWIGLELGDSIMCSHVQHLGGGETWIGLELGAQAGRGNVWYWIRGEVDKLFCFVVRQEVVHIEHPR